MILQNAKALPGEESKSERIWDFIQMLAQMFSNIYLYTFKFNELNLCPTVF